MKIGTSTLVEIPLDSVEVLVVVLVAGSSVASASAFCARFEDDPAEFPRPSPVDPAPVAPRALLPLCPVLAFASCSCTCLSSSAFCALDRLTPPEAPHAVAVARDCPPKHSTARTAISWICEEIRRIGFGKPVNGEKRE